MFLKRRLNNLRKKNGHDIMNASSSNKIHPISNENNETTELSDNNNNTNSIKAKMLTDFYNEENMTTEERELRDKQLIKDKLLKQGLKLIATKEREDKNNIKNTTSLEIQAIRGNKPIIVQSFEERMDHLKYLHYELKEDIFMIQYTTIHKSAMDGDIGGVRYFLDRRKKSGKFFRETTVHYSFVTNEIGFYFEMLLFFSFMFFCRHFFLLSYIFHYSNTLYRLNSHIYIV